MQIIFAVIFVIKDKVYEKNNGTDVVCYCFICMFIIDVLIIIIYWVIILEEENKDKEKQRL